MHVPIHDQDPPHAETALRVTSGESDIVEDTKTHAARRSGVVAGRSDEAERGFGFALHHSLNGRKSATRSTRSSVPGFGTNARVPRAELLASSLDLALGDFEVARIMDELQILAGDRSRPDLATTNQQPFGAKRLRHGLVSLRPLRVSWAGFVFLAKRVGGENHQAIRREEWHEVNGFTATVERSPFRGHCIGRISSMR
jgi:hypothetical protein